MKRLLLSLWLVGAAFPGHAPRVLPTAQGPPASAEQLVEARAASPLSGSATLESMPEPPHLGVERMADRSLVMRQDMQSATPPLEDGQTKNLSAHLPRTEETHEPSVPIPEGKNEAIWVEVIRWATVHVGPSVSAPTVRFYPVGTELHLIDYQDGWFQVLDPATLQRGWIYEKYYLQAIGGPGQGRVVARNSPSPPRVALRVPKPRPPLRRVKRPAPQQHEKIQPRIASARVQNESVASLLERAFRGY